MPKAASGWTTISLQPLIGLLDIRSRPADLPPGAVRWREGFQSNDEGKLCRRDGFPRFYADGSGPNYDHHHQGATREPITFLMETTGSDGTRRLFDGTTKRISWLDESAGTWNDITSAGQYRWRGAVLQDIAIFSDATGDLLQHALGSPTSSTIPDLIALKISAARVVVEFQGFILIMNIVQAGTRQMTRIWWTDFNLPISFALNFGVSQANFQDLTYGDEILAAAPLLGALYVFTRRAIWKLDLSGAASSSNPPRPFSFVRVYYEPENQEGCLLYPNTLTSDGQSFRYMSRDGIYLYNPFIPAPQRDDWLHRADGAIFTKSDTKFNGNLCDLPVAKYVPATRELWISWPSLGLTSNNFCLVAQTEKQVASIERMGFTAFVNFRRTPNPPFCNEQQSFIGASSDDWALKNIGGGVFYREFVNMPDPNDRTQDVPLEASYVQKGYYSILRGQIPTGLYDRQKLLRNVLLDADVTPQNEPCVAVLRVGNSFKLIDVNDQDNICVANWTPPESRPFDCPDPITIPQMKAQGLRASGPGISWAVFEGGVYLWYHLQIQASDGSGAIGGDACLDQLAFDVLALPKPVMALV